MRCPAHVEGAGHLSERERTAPDSAWWRDLFEERAAIREHEGGASRAEAEAGALADLVARWRALHALPASADGACVQCGKPGPDTPVLAKAGHAWLHRQCWPAMNAKRETQARAAVKAMLGRASAVDTAQEILEIGAQIKPGH